MHRPTAQNARKLTRREALRRMGLGAACALVATSGVASLLAAEAGVTERTTRSGTTAIPCKGCGACEPCPYGVEIVHCFGVYNEAALSGTLPDPSKRGRGYRRLSRRFLSDYRNAIDRFGRADRCIGCRRCEERCPERLPVVAYLRQVEALTERLTHEEMQSP